MKIVITGGSGFIGTHLSNYLKKDHDITVFDRNRPPNSEVNYVEGDIIDSSQVKKTLEGCEVVIHLAAAVGVEITENDPILTLNINIFGTKNVLDACVQNGVQKIIFASSSEIYGEPFKVPIDEISPLMPITNYGVSKIAAEEFIEAYSKVHGIKYSVLRFFNVYGPGQSTDFVIPEFVNNAIIDKPITIHGSGSQVRAFCHVDDISNGISLCIKKGDNEVFNIGNGTEPISITDLAKKVVELTNSKSEIKFIPFEDSERKRRKEIFKRIPSIGKAKKLLGYEPRISLNEGIMSVFSKKN